MNLPDVQWLNVVPIVSAIGGVVTALGLRRYIKALLWDRHLRRAGVSDEQRQQVAIDAARVDLLKNFEDPQDPAEVKQSTDPSSHTGGPTALVGVPQVDDAS